MRKQKLITKTIEKKLQKYPIYSQDGVPAKEKVVVFKIFNPYGSGTWLITEGNRLDNDDWYFFGLVCLNGIQEWGYFTLKQLEEVQVPVFGYKFPLERDTYLDCEKLGTLRGELNLEEL